MTSAEKGLLIGGSFFYRLVVIAIVPIPVIAMASKTDRVAIRNVWGSGFRWSLVAAESVLSHVRIPHRVVVISQTTHGWPF